MTRIGLLTPYSGTNLGDGATMIAMVENLRRVIPGVVPVGITMNPAETTRLHAIEAVRITGLEVRGYSEGIYSLPTGVITSAPAASPAPAPGGSSVRRAIKAIPGVGKGLRWVADRLRGLRRILRELRDLPRVFQQVRRLDLLVISGGGQLHDAYGGPWAHPYAIFRWTILASLAGTPMICVSIGAQAMRHRLSRFFLRTALRRARYRSYREAITKQQLAHWRFTAGDPVVADLAFSIDAAGLTGDRPRDPRPQLVGLSPIAYGHAEHWPDKRPEVYQTYIDHLARFGAWLIARGNTLLIYRSGLVDRVAIADFKDRLVDIAGKSALQSVIEPPVKTVAQFFSEVSQATVVVASRLHGVIMPHIMGIPVLSLTFDQKVTTHVQDMGQEQYMVPIDDFTVEDLTNRFELLERNAGKERAEILRRGEAFRARLEEQYQYLRTMLPSQ